MGVFDRILVGVDGTDFGFEALHQALALAPEDSAVIAATALDTSIAMHAGFEAGDVTAQLEEEAVRIQATAAEILGDRRGAGTKLVRGDGLTVLRHLGEAENATLLALGGRSSSRFLGMMAGGTASTLLHDASRSVLFARPRWGQRWRPERIVVGLDGSECSLAALAVADELAGRLGSAIHVVAATGGKKIERDAAWAARVHDWSSSNPVATLRERSAGADLLILGSRGLHGVRALGSVSERVAHASRCSVLVVQPPAAA